MSSCLTRKIRRIKCFSHYKIQVFARCFFLSIRAPVGSGPHLIQDIRRVVSDDVDDDVPISVFEGVDHVEEEERVGAQELGFHLESDPAVVNKFSKACLSALSYSQPIKSILLKPFIRNAMTKSFGIELLEETVQRTFEGALK